MIVNPSQPEPESPLHAAAQGNPIVDAVSRAIQTLPDPFEVSLSETGIEVRACTFLSGGIPNRARMKIFSPRPGHTLVFFFKKSLVPYSRDRYSYGGLDLRTTQVNSEEVSQWLSFLTSGFHPDKRPENLRRAFPYEIPE